MLYVTGDTHVDFQRFQEEYFPEQKNMTKDDFVIICGDFGGVWNGSKRERRQLDRLAQKADGLARAAGGETERAETLALVDEVRQLIAKREERLA